MSMVIPHTTSPAFVRKHYRLDGEPRQHVVGEVIGWQEASGGRWLPLVVMGGSVIAKTITPTNGADGEYYAVVFDDEYEEAEA
jgi:hypothetical protein